MFADIASSELMLKYRSIQLCHPVCSRNIASIICVIKPDGSRKPVCWLEDPIGCIGGFVACRELGECTDCAGCDDWCELFCSLICDRSRHGDVVGDDI